MDKINHLIEAARDEGFSRGLIIGTVLGCLGMAIMVKLGGC